MRFSGFASPVRLGAIFPVNTAHGERWRHASTVGKKTGSGVTYLQGFGSLATPRVLSTGTRTAAIVSPFAKSSTSLETKGATPLDRRYPRRSPRSEPTFASLSSRKTTRLLRPKEVRTRRAPPLVNLTLVESCRLASQVEPRQMLRCHHFLTFKPRTSKT